MPTGPGAGWLDDDDVVVDGARPVFTRVTDRVARVYSLGRLLGVPGTREVVSRTLDALRTSLHDREYGAWYACLVGVS